VPLYLSSLFDEQSIIMPIQLRPPPGTPGAAWPAICVGLFVAFGGVLFGYDTGTIGGILAMPYWLKTFSTGYTVDGLPAITSSQSSQIVSILVSNSKKATENTRSRVPCRA
jgi:hypothetical protein